LMQIKFVALAPL